jgi:formylmethanofuran:tetrahydromethanopterin formyltransferase
MKITASILDYIGKYEGGILTSVGLMYDGIFYESIFYYTNNKMIITIDNTLKEKIGDIELHEDYIPLMESIINKVDPYENIVETLKEINIDVNTGNSHSK